LISSYGSADAGREPWRRFATPLVPTPARLVADGMRRWPPEVPNISAKALTSSGSTEQAPRATACAGTARHVRLDGTIP
jgi:hypothetical protein